MTVFLTNKIAKNEDTPYIKSLEIVINKLQVCSTVAKGFLQQAQQEKNQTKHEEIMSDINELFVQNNLNLWPDNGQRWALELPNVGVYSSVVYRVMRCLAYLPSTRFSALMQSTTQFCVATNINRALMKTRAAGKFLRVALFIVVLSWDIIQNIKRWWRGDISDTRCVKNITDCGLSAAAGIAGGFCGEILGAYIGSSTSPAGAAAGCLAGALFGAAFTSYSVQILSDRLTQWYFGLPKNDALDNAYRYYGLPPFASNSEINPRYN